MSVAFALRLGRRVASRATVPGGTALLGSEVILKDAARAYGSASSPTYSYILVGGGTASCLLANRLAKSDPTKRVLMLEAGGADYTHPLIRVPAGVIKLFKSSKDWDFTTDAAREEGLSEGHRGVYLCRGKVLGGSSCTNVSLYNRGTARDYDAWDCPGWSSRDVLPYFMLSECNHGDKVNHKFHGTEGNFHVSDPQYVNPLTARFLQACENAGVDSNQDFNDWDRPQDGAGAFQVAQRSGERSSAATAFLQEEVGHLPNLEVVTDATVTKVRVEGTAGGQQATGVDFTLNGERRSVSLDPGGEVVLAAGSVGSPHVLMLSGIGPREELGGQGIECVADLPVGQNLQDHPAVVATFQIEEDIAATSDLYKMGMVNPLAVLSWLVRGKGVLTTVGCDHGGFFKTKPQLQDPDVQIRFVPALARDPLGISNYVQLGSKAAPWDPGYTFQVLCARPKSKGSVTLRSSDPMDKPVITTGYFTAKEDLTSLVQGLKLARGLAGNAAFAGLNPVEKFPGKEVSEDDELEQFVRRSTHSGNALVGSCKMGTSAQSSVVDPELKVHGISSLRVIDSSVIPTLPGGQTCSATLMVAERGAELLQGNKR